VTPRTRGALGPAAATATAALLVAVAAPSASAADGNGVKVVNTETVQVYTSPTGQVQTRRVYEQLSLTGKGSVDLRNPISTDHLRNLDGFGGFDVQNGEQVTRTTVDGEKKVRSVSDYAGDLPLNVSVRYRLDGRTVHPGDLVGNDGKLDVQYTVENVTGKPQQVSFADGKGGTVTRTVDVPIPMVGSLSLVAPPTFTNVRSKQANIAGDGKGGTKLSFTMTLFPPIGSTTAVFGYTADITDGVVPRSEISALPVNPLGSPTFATAATSYKGGADTGTELTAGATQIDQNLLKLRDGAGDLLAGLIKLRDGADQLNAGLAGQAAPGARTLASGANDLNSGLGQINSGAKQLADGTGELVIGTGTLTDGTGRLRKGAEQVAGGANDLSDGTAEASAGSRRLFTGTKDLDTGAAKVADGATTVDGFMKQIAAGQGDLLSGLSTLEQGVQALPASVQAQLAQNADYQRLLGTLDKVVLGIGTPNDTTRATLMGGLKLLQLGLRSPLGTATCDQNPLDDTNRADDCGAADGAEIISGKLANGVTTIDNALLPSALGAYDALVATAGCTTRAGSDLAPLPPSSNLGLPGNSPCRAAAVSAYGYGLPAGVLPAGTGFGDGGLKAQATLASQKLAVIAKGLTTEAIPGIQAVEKALYNADCNPAQTDPAAGDFCGISQALSLVKAGVPVLVDSITGSIRDTLSSGISAPAGGCRPTSKTLLCGAAALATGGTLLSAGTGELAAGAGDLTDGTAKLSSKTGELAAGLGRIDDGAGKVAAGAGQVADGTEDADTGSAKLDAGARKLDDGAGRLARGTGKAADGSRRLLDGADTLAGGLQGAADGSGQLSDGLRTAADGAPRLVDGAQKLSDQGTKKLIAAGTTTAQSYGELYATMTAGAKRAQAEDMAFGAPKDAVGLTAYSYVISGDDGEGGRNLTRGAGGLALLGAGGAVFALRRRLV
jgi:putative membrane protein